MAAIVKRGKPTSGPRSFSGAVATTGNSRGLRLERAFFQAAPEFGTPGSAIRADVIGPGTVLVRVDAAVPEVGGDPMIGAWLSFLDQDVATTPARLVPLGEAEIAGLEALVADVVVDDDYVLPEDVTF